MTSKQQAWRKFWVGWPFSRGRDEMKAAFEAGYDAARVELVNEIRSRMEAIKRAGNDSGSSKDQNFIDGGLSALEVLADDTEDQNLPRPETNVDKDSPSV